MSNPYLSPPDLTNYGVTAVALSPLTTTQQQDQCDSAAGVVDNHLRGRYALPLTPPAPPEIIEATAAIAIWRLMQIRGLNPASPDYVLFRDRYLDAMSYLGKIQRQALHLNAAVASQTGNNQQPLVSSQSLTGMWDGTTAPNRGW